MRLRHSFLDAVALVVTLCLSSEITPISASPAGLQRGHMTEKDIKSLSQHMHFKKHRSRAEESPDSKPKEEEKKPDNKYFHEPGGDDLLGHYDIRYYKGLNTYDDRQETQLHMLKAYLQTFEDHGLETWIAHGTLLGWWWNGKLLPWDWDIDTQVSEATLFYLGDIMNGSMHSYTAPSPRTGENITHTYLLDVNRHVRERENGDGQNIIDARWIDVSNGLYIDITGLSELHPDVQPGVVGDKNYHRYTVVDLYPMRETYIEGTVTKVPYAYDKMLLREYTRRALTLTTFEGHTWHEDEQVWIKNPTPANTIASAHTS
ncbi:hypothetical protein MMC25_000876 [Agyrium rufum]|nr:hypothetical protein [Agyrium rufum]